MVWAATDELDFETVLAQERPRLVRLCARLSGSTEAAEDLAQETILAAWRGLDSLRQPDSPQPWLSGIARNVCLGWSRRYYREQSHLAPALVGGSYADDLADPADPAAAWERAEQVAELDRALDMLPADSRALLVAYYLEDASQAQIAARLGISERAVTMRLHRGRIALRHALDKVHAAPAAAAGWEETRIWCINCGGRHMEGRFVREGSGGVFMMRCPACEPPGSISSLADLSIPFYGELLGGVRTYKPAFSRLLNGVAAYFRNALQTGAAACQVCGASASLRVGQRDREGNPEVAYEVRTECPACGWRSNSALTSLVLALPQAQRFWRANPRLHTLPVQEIDRGFPALVTRLRSVGGAAALDVVSRRDDLALVAVHGAPDA